MAAARVPAAGEKGGGEGEQVEGVLFYPPRGPGSEEEAGEATGARRPWRQCSPWRHSEREGDDRWGPLSDSSPFSIFRISSRALYLIEALKQF